MALVDFWIINNYFISNSKFIKERVNRIILKLILLYLIFFAHIEENLLKNSVIPQIDPLRLLDEITIVGLWFLALSLYISRTFVALPSSFYAILICSLLSAFINILSDPVELTKKIFISILGIFDNIKSITMFLPFSVLSWNKKNLTDIYNFLRKIAVIGSVFAIVEFTSLFFFGESISKIFYIFDSGLLIKGKFGIPAVGSIYNSTNSLALYSLIFVCIDLGMLASGMKINKTVLLIFIISILTSGSRMGVLSLILVLSISTFLSPKAESIRRKIMRKLSVALLIILISIFLIIFVAKKILNEFISLSMAEYTDDIGSYRAYSLFFSLKLLYDKPLFGVGPGMFGGMFSFIFDSPIYRDYGFSQLWYEYGREMNSIDMFWPQIWGEIGIIGFLSFIFFMYKMFSDFLKKGKNSIFLGDNSLGAILIGCSLFLPCLLIMGLGSSLNIPTISVPFGCLAGIALSSYRKLKNTIMNHNNQKL